ncbi:MAG: monovalent cation/H+ antiporter complex subunit F [Treponema sp.]|nr:monovalent cation/H+ antiporter complex subunit F [Treponema sp.]
MFEYAQAVRYLLMAGMLFLAGTLFFCLFFVISRGHKITDRIVATNMIGVKGILLIVIVAVFVGEAYLIDVAFVYALLSFLATIVFTRFLAQFKINKTKSDGQLDAGKNERYEVT